MVWNKVQRIGILLILSVMLLLGAAQLAVSYADIGITNDFWTGLPAAVSDFSSVPQSVVNDASRLAAELFGKNQAKYERFISQMLAMYEDARYKDVVVLFNPGGWGWKNPDPSQGWGTILDGIQTELTGMGYQSVVLDYRRTAGSVGGCFDEIVELFRDYPTKGKFLASRVAFLTDNLPDLKVLITGESNGTVISESVMLNLRGDSRVYSIQTGTPFWDHRETIDRTLVLNSNGTGPDTFSDGDFPAMIWATIKATLGIEQTAGTVLLHLKAPGHDYSWSYPTIYQQVTGFLENSFGIKTN